jgi:hypothetical protein
MRGVGARENVIIGEWEEEGNKVWEGRKGQREPCRRGSKKGKV